LKRVTWSRHQLQRYGGVPNFKKSRAQADQAAFEGSFCPQSTYFSLSNCIRRTIAAPIIIATICVMQCRFVVRYFCFTFTGGGLNAALVLFHPAPKLRHKY